MSIDLQMPAYRLLAALQRKKISATELMTATLDRIRALNPKLNAIIALEEERALAQAGAIDKARMKGEKLGYLAGLPVTVKDAIDVEGFATCAGVEALRNNRPMADAPATQRLKAASAIILGKTNVPPMSGDFQTTNPVFGTTNNPWRLDHTPGGSSGGAAAAIASGMSALELGTDLGGSVRWPAHACGVFGLKPTYDLIPLGGMVPPPPGVPSTPNVRLGAIGPLARSAKDLELMLAAVAGPAEAALSLKLPGAQRQGLKGARLALLTTHPLAPTMSAVREGVVAAGAALAQEGAIVEEIDDLPAKLTDIHRLFSTLMMALVTLSFPEKLKAALIEKAKTIAPDDPSGEAGQARGAALNFAGFMAAEAERAKLEQMMADFFGRYDALLCPPATTLAFPHDHGPFTGRLLDIDGVKRPHGDFSAWSSIAGLLRLPAAVAPTGLSAGGLPTGVQIIAPRYQDLRTIALAERVGKQLNGYRKPPL